MAAKGDHSTSPCPLFSFPVYKLPYMKIDYSKKHGLIPSYQWQELCKCHQWTGVNSKKDKQKVRRQYSKPQYLGLFPIFVFKKSHWNWKIMHFVMLILPVWQCLKNCDIVCYLQGVWWGEQSSRALVSPGCGRVFGREPCPSVSVCLLALVPCAGLRAAA